MEGPWPVPLRRMTEDHALDAVATRTIETLVSRWLNESKTLRASVWVTHDPKQKERVADRILWLEQGRLKEIADV